MTFNPDIIRTVVFSAATHEPSLLARYEEAEIDRHKRLLLHNGFASGDETIRENVEKRLAASSCPIDTLTVDGESLLDLSSNEEAWRQTEETYAEEGYSWSLCEFHEFLRSQART
jgi:predicted nucleotide-binding protein